MIELQGKYNSAKVFTDNIEETASSQIIKLLCQDFIVGAKVRIMPDTHAGVGCVIGFTADLGNKVIPNLVGVDIGCGMAVTELGDRKINPAKLDEVIHDFIPAGHDVHKQPVIQFREIEDLVCFKELKGDYGKFVRGVGSLGGGNHFIELNVDEAGCKYLVIHSGSRNLGKQVAEYYQDLAIESCKGLGELSLQKSLLVEKLKAEGKSKSIQSSLKELDKSFKTIKPKYPKELCFLEGELRNNYLHDMEICQKYAYLSRKTMSNIILENVIGKDSDDFDGFQTIHNYIDFSDNIIRKGAVSAYEDERLIIPINMRDGSILATGKGNPDWNSSAPHGAGRLMGRSEAKRKLSLDDFVRSMSKVYTTTANASTLDEAPKAYKPMQEILDNIQDTVVVEKIIKPIYNFKASE